MGSNCNLESDKKFGIGKFCRKQLLHIIPLLIFVANESVQLFKSAETEMPCFNIL